MRIYADFNGAEDCTLSDGLWRLDLTGYGTIAALSNSGIRLARGLVLTFGDPDGLTVVAPVEFDGKKISSTSSGWYIRFKKSDIRNETPIEHDHNVHQCFFCHKNIKPYLDKVGRQFNENCPYCGTSIMAPLAAPSA